MIGFLIKYYIIKLKEIFVDVEIIWMDLLIWFLLIIIFWAVVMNILKSSRRRHDYMVIKECLNEDNIKLITDDEDVELLKEYEKKFRWYARTLWINLTPNYWARYKKVKEIIKKYDLDIKWLVKITKEEGE